MSDWPWDIRFEVAFGIDPLADPGPGDWTDLSSRVRPGVTVEHRPADSPGTANLTLNNRDRALDPTNPAAVHNLVPMRHARLRCVHDAVTVDLYRGYVEDWVPVWPEFNQGLVSVTIAHALDIIAPIEMDVDLPAQRSGERIDALLDLAGWPATRRDVATGKAWLDPVTQEGASLLGLAFDAAACEDGMPLHVSPSGDVVFRDKHHLFLTDPTVAFGPDDHRVAAVQPYRPPVVNFARMEMADGDVVVLADDESMDAYGRRPFTERDLPVSAVQQESIGAWAVVRFAQPTLALDGLMAHGHGIDADLAGLLGLALGDLASFVHTPTGGGDPVEMTGQVAEVTHSIGAGSWTTTAALAPWFGDRPYLRLGDPVLGIMDGTRVAAP